MNIRTNNIGSYKIMILKNFKYIPVSAVLCLEFFDLDALLVSSF